MMRYMGNLKSGKRNTLSLVLFVIYLLVLIWAILFKGRFAVSVPDEGRIINLIPLAGSFDDGVINFNEIIENILAFIPLGIYLCMVKSKWAFVKKLLVIIGTSLGFEIVQFVFAIGRTDITDVLTNTLGGIIGIGVYALLLKLLKDKTNIVINLLVLAFIVIAFVLSIAFLSANGRWMFI
jgi:glycopeptide antibiotics resistance protein